MKNDRFLTVILVVIALLVVVSLSLFFIRQDSATYLAEDTPSSIVHNYILAIEKGEYERAYGYLAEKELKPSYAEFEQNFLFYDNNTGYQIGETAIAGNTASVEVTIMEGSGGFLFERHYDYVENAGLSKENGEWKIVQMPYNYWSWEWYTEE
ncbi:MAG: DUF4878 domain-containing protein [Chloroflexi bacterium]|nr:DUF4878 domain-containing protein [Chloroflexota bacterium]